MNRMQAIILVILLTLISGWGDAQGFIHTSKVWDNGRFMWSEAGKSALGYAVGTIVFWFAIKYLQELKVFAVEVQTIFWFSVVIVGVAIASGKFFQWGIVEKCVGILVLIGISYLLVRTGS